MQQIDFYLLAEDETVNQSPLLLSLLENELAAHRQVGILTTDSEQAKALDDWLWTGKPDSFLAHAVIQDQSQLDERIPIHIGTTLPTRLSVDTCINLNRHIPAEPARYANIIELIPSEASLKQQARERYKSYQQLGLAPQLQKSEVTDKS